MSNQVITTTDYNIFNHVYGNRNINKLHVKRLSESFKEKYLVSPIIVNEKYQIIDGQHRFLAAKELGLPIRYLMVNGYGLREVQILNVNSKNWLKRDYLNAYCDLGYDAYLKMKTFMLDFPDFGILGAEILLTKNTKGANNTEFEMFEGKKRGRDSFQEGNLVIRDLDLAYAWAKRIMQIKPFFAYYNHVPFIAAMIMLFKNKNYDHNLMMHKIDKHNHLLKHQKDQVEYVKHLEEIYNYRNQTKVSLRY